MQERRRPVGVECRVDSHANPNANRRRDRVDENKNSLLQDRQADVGNARTKREACDVICEHTHEICRARPSKDWWNTSAVNSTGKVLLSATPSVMPYMNKNGTCAH